MKQDRVSVCLGLWVCLLGSSVAALREHYCERNVSVSSIVPVTKQRTVVKQPSKWKVWKKAQQITETFETMEEQINYKLVSECCAGYLQVESGLCEPICEGGCPAFASCVAPQRCQCTTGYISARDHRDGSHYCEPICERGCSSGSQCVAPNTCACKDGYRAQQPTGDAVSAPCEPTCQLGDGCANGSCIDVERCVCNEGFSWSMFSHRCEAVSEEEVTVREHVLELRSSTSTTTSESLEVADCSEGFILYGGECRPEIFESNESTSKDCHKTGCGSHQSCNDQGNCVCNSGYVEDEKKDVNSKLSCHRSLLGDILSIDQAADEEDNLNMFTIPILGVASGVLFVLLIAGLFTRHQRRGRGENQNSESQPKEANLQCEFTQKSYDVDEWVP